jgi:hypothetical protein
MTNWTSSIPAKVRSALYIVFGAASLAITAVTAWAGAVGNAAPSWIAGATAVLGVIGGAIGFTAAGNTSVDGDVATVEDTDYVFGDEPYDGDPEATETEADREVADTYTPRHST